MAEEGRRQLAAEIRQVLARSRPWPADARRLWRRATPSSSRSRRHDCSHKYP